MASVYSTNLLCYCFIIVTSFYLASSKTIYKKINTKMIWKDAASYCHGDQGQLAILHDLDCFTYELETIYTSMHINEAWIGGRLYDEGWNWFNNSHGKDEYIPIAPLVEYRGCYRPKFIMGGFRMIDITAERCFKKCLWKGAIGLKSTYCICERYLRNISLLEDDGCDIRCSGNRREKCGSPRGTSMYQLSKNAVLWGKGEPSDNKGCAYLRKYDVTQEIFWFTTECHMRHRYLCQFYDNHVCGSQKSCIRWSISPATWERALLECKKLNGSAAIVDASMMHTDDDIRVLPPGVYWIGLRRKREWRWVDGTQMSESSVSRYEDITYNEQDCTIIQQTPDGIRMESNHCDNRLPFICEYEVENEVQSAEKKASSPGISKDVLSNNTQTDKEDSRSKTYKSVMYLAVGVAAGMALVFAICVIIYLIRRCFKRSIKHRSSYGHNKDNFEVCNASNTSSLRSTRANQGHRDLVYDIPVDTEDDSPFRRTQRIIKQGSWRADADGYRSNSWRRTRNGSHGEKRERAIVAPEIRAIYPPVDRSFRDASYVIHKVQAQCHPNNNVNRDVNYTGSLNIKHRNSDLGREDDIKLAETYSLPPQSRKASENDSLYHVDTSDLYTCVARAMTKLSEDKNLDRHSPNEDIMFY